MNRPTFFIPLYMSRIKILKKRKSAPRVHFPPGIMCVRYSFRNQSCGCCHPQVIWLMCEYCTGTILIVLCVRRCFCCFFACLDVELHMIGTRRIWGSHYIVQFHTSSVKSEVQLSYGIYPCTVNSSQNHPTLQQNGLFSLISRIQHSSYSPFSQSHWSPCSNFWVNMPLRVHSALAVPPTALLQSLAGNEQSVPVPAFRHARLSWLPLKLSVCP